MTVLDTVNCKIGVVPLTQNAIALSWAPEHYKEALFALHFIDTFIFRIEWGGPR